MQAALWVTFFFITAILITLCFDEGVDLDEAYSYTTVRGNSLLGIGRDILAANDTDVPLYYIGLYLWTRVFGESFLACRLFSVAGTVASMLLGVTVIRRLWGNRTSFLFLLFSGLTPAMIHVGVNIRMYSWTIFLITLCALEIYFLVREPDRGRLWFALSLTTFAGLFSHYFTAFSYMFLYLWLLLEMIHRKQRGIWKLFLCGGIPLIPTAVWFAASGILQFAGSENGASYVQNISWETFFSFLFFTRLEYSVLLGSGVFLLALFALFGLRKKYGGTEWRFIFFSLLNMPCSYVAAGVAASLGSHFFIPRHVMHSIGLLWLAMAIILSRVNLPTYGFSILFTAVMAGAAYRAEYALSYDTTPYLEDTMKFAADHFQEGDIVIYNADGRFGMLYSCYLPELTYLCFWELDDPEEMLREAEGERVWFFQSQERWFSAEIIERFGITYENLGHYGFQIMDGSTEFDVLRLEIRGEAE